MGSRSDPDLTNARPAADEDIPYGPAFVMSAVSGRAVSDQPDPRPPPTPSATRHPCPPPPALLPVTQHSLARPPEASCPPPCGVLPTGVLPTGRGIFPTGVLPTGRGIFPTERASSPPRTTAQQIEEGPLDPAAGRAFGLSRLNVVTAAGGTSRVNGGPIKLASDSA